MKLIKCRICIKSHKNYTSRYLFISLVTSTGHIECMYVFMFASMYVCMYVCVCMNICMYECT